MLNRLLVACSLTLALPTLSSAQSSDPPPRPAPESPRMCDMSYKMLSLTVVNRRGAPVPGVSVELTGIDANAEGRPARTTSETGEVLFAEDGDMRFLAPGGSNVTVTLRKGSKVRRVAMRLGRDEGGCHIALLSGPKKIRF